MLQEGASAAYSANQNAVNMEPENLEILLLLFFSFKNIILLLNNTERLFGPELAY